MTTDENNQDGGDNQEGAGEGEETITVPKKDYDKLNQDFGSLKREHKDLKKSFEEKPKETPKENQKPDESGLLLRVEKLALKTAGISHPDDVELARTTAKKWGMDLEDVLGDEDFKVKLEKLQTSRTNLEATSNIKGNSGVSQAKNSPEYWIKKGTPPSSEEVPDKATRRKIARVFMENAEKGDGKKFYND